MRKSAPVIAPLAAKDKIILPLDVSEEAAALDLVGRLGDAITFYKIGLELFTRIGPTGVQRIRAAMHQQHGSGARLFLDLKFHDIPNTVASAVRSAAALDVDLLTVHLSGGRAMLEAAAAAVTGRTLLLGVSVLTSLDDAGLRETGVADGAAAQVMRLVALGLSCGLRGFVVSPHEVAALRVEFGADLVLVTPGVRPTWASGDDQRRIMTPGEAMRAGADYLVIGRPIAGHRDPRAAAERVAAELAGA